jgi:periplasmic protein TonB
MIKVILIVLGIALNQLIIAQDLDPIYFDRAPQFQGGMENLLKSIQDSMKYPPESLKNKIGGRVVISMIIDTTGFPKNLKILKGINPELDSEALRIISSLPPWYPAEANGKKLPIPLMVPVTFDPKKNHSKRIKINKN